MTPSLFLASLIAILATATPAPDTYPRQPGIDIVHYAFHLTLSDDSDSIRGDARIQVGVREAGVRELFLDLVSPREDGRGMTVERIEIDGSESPFEHTADRLRIPLPDGPGAGDRVRVRVIYGGIPADGLKIGPDRYGDRTFFSNNWPNRARHWLPTVDHISDKATHEFIVDAPSHYQVVSNGLRIEETDLGDGMRRTHWRQSVPTSPWLYCVGVAEFAMQRVDTFDDREIQTWVLRQDRDAGFYDYAVPTKHVLQFYSDYVGPFAYEKLANVQSSSVGGGMEAASAIFYNETSVVGDRNTRWRNVIIHEIAHQWFGNAVTEADWDHVWLSEGVTTYFTLLFREHAYGRDDFVEGLRDARRRVWAFHQEHPDYRIVHDNLDDMSQVTTGQIYQKGAWIMHMLRHRIGDEAFRTGIRSYYADHFNGTATTDDLRRAMERASGMDLKLFFTQWLYRGGHPVLEGGWTWKNGVLTVDLAEVQRDGYAFDLPVEIGIVSGDGLVPEIRSIDLAGMERAVVDFPLEVRPARVVLDPNTVLLAEWTFEER